MNTFSKRLKSLFQRNATSDLNTHKFKKFNPFKHFLIFSALIFSLNVSAAEVSQFNKQAYLDFSQEYNYVAQPVVRRAMPIDSALTGVYSSMRNSLGSTNSNNYNQLGGKIATDLKNKTESTILGRTQTFVNTTLNNMANSLGNGRTEISIKGINEAFNYSVDTIQPLGGFDENSQQLTFVQASLFNGHNEGERRNTLNLGLGQRYLIQNQQAIVGVNLFMDYETESQHTRGSLGLEYQRSNFGAGTNIYFPLSEKKTIDEYNEEVLAGHDLKINGQMPYIPWVTLKGTRYYWDQKVSDDISGTVLGTDIRLSGSTRVELGLEDSSGEDISNYAKLTVQFPFKESTDFSLGSQVFRDSSPMHLTDLKMVDRSKKIRIEKTLNEVSATVGVFNATTTNATCTLYNASGTPVANGLGVTNDQGLATFTIKPLASGLASLTCIGGEYLDEATGVTTNAPDLRAAMIYPGTGSLTLMATPLSEIAYQLSDTNNGNLSIIAGAIADKNTSVASAFGLEGVNILSTIPTDLNTTTSANDDAGKLGLILASIAQMGENSVDANPSATIKALVDDMTGADDSAANRINGRHTGMHVVTLAQAIDNLANNGGDNNTRIGAAAGHVGKAASAIGAGSIKGDLALELISNYDGTGVIPTRQNYVDAGVINVTDSNLGTINLKLSETSSADADTTAKIQALVDDIVEDEKNFSIDGVSDAKVAENLAFRGVVPVIIGDPIGTITYSVSGEDGKQFSIDQNTGVIKMDAQDYENPNDVNRDNDYIVQIVATDLNGTAAAKVQTVTVTDVIEGTKVDFNGLSYLAITSPHTGKIWLDRNLGATQACVRTNDIACYGDLYQWGRNDDGHQVRTSETTTTLATQITPSLTAFVSDAGDPYDWSTVDSIGNLRSDGWTDQGVNDICPPAFGVPSEAELQAETLDVNVSNAEDAFNGFLKWPLAGHRRYEDAILDSVDVSAFIWSLDYFGDEARYLDLRVDNASLNAAERAQGGSVRCVGGLNANSSSAALGLISAYDGTNTEPSVQNYKDAGVTGVTDDNLSDVNEQVADADPVDSDATSEIQVLANIVIELFAAESLVKITGYGNVASIEPPRMIDYARIGVSSVSSTAILNELNIQIKPLPPGERDSAGEIQNILPQVTKVVNILTRISNYTGSNSAPTLKDYEDIGLTFNESALPEVNWEIAVTGKRDSDTFIEIQPIVNKGVAVYSSMLTIKSYVNAIDTRVPATADYTTIGIFYVTSDTIAAINQEMALVVSADRDTTPKVRAIVDARLQESDSILAQIREEADVAREVRSIVTFAQLDRILPILVGHNKTSLESYHNFIDTYPGSFSYPVLTVEELQNMVDRASLPSVDVEPEPDPTAPTNPDDPVDPEPEDPADPEEPVDPEEDPEDPDGIYFRGLYYNEVSSHATGRVWLDRNLGAKKVCLSVEDGQKPENDGVNIYNFNLANCFGDYYQWGRLDDGHQLKTSTTTDDWIESLERVSNQFVLDDGDWLGGSGGGVDFWGKIRNAEMLDGGTQDICPPGFNVPSADEVSAEDGRWGIMDEGPDHALESFLRLPAAGYRHPSGNYIKKEGIRVYMWTRSRYHDFNDSPDYSWSYVSKPGKTYMNASQHRGGGLSIRCIDNSGTGE